MCILWFVTTSARVKKKKKMRFVNDGNDFNVILSVINKCMII